MTWLLVLSCAVRCGAQRGKDGQVPLQLLLLQFLTAHALKSPFFLFLSSENISHTLRTKHRAACRAAAAKEAIALHFSGAVRAAVLDMKTKNDDDLPFDCGNYYQDEYQQSD